MVKRQTAKGIRTKGEKKLQAVIYGLLSLCCLIAVFPFLDVFSKSISSESAVLAGEVNLLPVGVNFNAYRYVLKQSAFFTSLLNTTVVVITGTILALATSCLTAYVISRKRFQGTGAVLFLYIFTMVFNAGLIPGYLLIKDLGIYDTLWALILPAVTNPFYLFILKSYMGSVPISLEEAARIDGAGHFRTLLSIMLPLSKPAIASLCLFFAVDMWNDFFRPMSYIMSEENYTLQLYLRSILVNVNDVQNTIDPLVDGLIAPQSIQNATIIVSIIPILILYPFLQKHFVSGITVGAVKE